MPIPPEVHFCWIGTALPWAYVFAVLSAAGRSGMPITLHHVDALEDGAELRALRNAPGVTLSPIEPRAFLDEVGAMLGVGSRLRVLYDEIAETVTRTDLLRAAILYRHGGVYLDLDTVTVASLLPLLDHTHFVGSEFVVWPRPVRTSRSGTVWARHLALDLVRKVLRWSPQGWRMFRRIETFYARVVNNAVMGAEPNGSLFSDYLLAMLAVTPAQRTRRYALGPHLLQEVVDRYRRDDLAVQEPRVFYPLAPEISEHWFRERRRLTLDAVLPAETRVVHWYASIRGTRRVMQITPGYVRARRETQFYSMLVDRCLREFLGAA